jgi:FkbM family methyltransferase
MNYKYFKENPVKIRGVVHAGAHRGEELQWYRDREASKIIWIEPSPDVYKELQVALELAGAKSSYSFCVAASDKDDENVDFHICYGPDARFMEGNKGCSSLLIPKNGTMIGTWYKETIVVKTIRVDSLLERNGFDYNQFDLLNIDTQGAEMLVLRGCPRLLNEIKYISLEVTWNNPYYEENPLFEEIRSFLEKSGFKLEEVDSLTSDWGDALFIKK